AVIAAVLAVLAIGGGDKADAQKEDQVTVVEAVVDIPPHTILTAEDLIEREIDATDMVAGAITSKAAVIGQSYRVQLVATQQLVGSELEQPGIRNVIENGKRGFALPVNEANRLSGLLADNDHVDIAYKTRINVQRLLPTSEGVLLPEDGLISGGSSVTLKPVDADLPLYPNLGQASAPFTIADDIGPEQALEPVAKIMLQDLRVLRVVAPGQSFTQQGQVIDGAIIEPSAQGSGAPILGYLILEVSNQQAELLTFMVDERSEFQVLVRGNDDRDQVSTTGITFEILASDADYALPLPQAVTAAAVSAADDEGN
ncbi:MAG: hypothetical protein M3R06_03780, partial [Chloroflexota bacterium]|nr:hypothetical protein [Chloroflexota bacterium]